MELRNGFNGLDLIDKVPDEYGQRFMTLEKRQRSRPSARKRNVKRQNGCLRNPYKYLRKEEKLKAREQRNDISI